MDLNLTEDVIKAVDAVAASKPAPAAVKPAATPPPAAPAGAPK